jgi:hypothetical protein
MPAIASPAGAAAKPHPTTTVIVTQTGRDGAWVTFLVGPDVALLNGTAQEIPLRPMRLLVYMFDDLTNRTVGEWGLKAVGRETGPMLNFEESPVSPGLLVLCVANAANGCSPASYGSWSGPKQVRVNSTDFSYGHIEVRAVFLGQPGFAASKGDSSPL